MKAPRLGRVQMRIMRVLWEKGPCTVRAITDALNEEAPIAHSTVQTLLRKIEDKGAVTHDADNRTFVFRAAVSPEQVRSRATREFIDGLFDGSTAGLVAYLLRHERIPPGEMSRIRQLIDEAQDTDDSPHAVGRPNPRRR